jgi:hypothetical protein
MRHYAQNIHYNTVKISNTELEINLGEYEHSSSTDTNLVNLT